MNKKLKIHDGDTPGKTFEVKLEYPKPDKEFPSCAYDVCAEFDCEETMALALIATRNELERTRKALEIAVDALKEIDKTRSVANHKIGTQDKTLNSGIVFCWATPDEIHNVLEQITALEQKDVK